MRTHSKRSCWRLIGPWLVGLAVAGFCGPLSAEEPPPSPVAPTPDALQQLAHQDDAAYHMVAIEALVVEVSEDHTRDLGLSYGINSISVNAAGLPVIEAPGSILQGGLAELGSAPEPVRVPVLIRGPGGTNTIGFDGGRLPGLGVSLVGMNVGSQVVSARLRALLQRGDASIRTRPVAVALNGSRTTIKATEQIPYQDMFTKAGNNMEVKFEEVGVKMVVVPTIVSLRPGVAMLDVAELEVSSVSNYVTTWDVDRPVFSRSHTKTQVTLSEGETFVVGGLKTRRKMTHEDRVPLLGAIPVLGLLFRSQSTVERNMDVLFFITPSILAPGGNFLLPFDFKNQRALGMEDVTAQLAEN